MQKYLVLALCLYLSRVLEGNKKHGSHEAAGFSRTVFNDRLETQKSEFFAQYGAFKTTQGRAMLCHCLIVYQGLKYLKNSKTAIVELLHEW